MRFSKFVVLGAVVMVNSLFWAEFNRPVKPSDYSYPIQSLSYNVYQRHQDPYRGDTPRAEDIERDMEVLSQKTRAIRLYNSEPAVESIPALAKKFNMKVIASAWLDADSANNLIEVDAAIRLAGRNRNVSRLILGNETQLHQTVPREELLKYLKEARKRLRSPVSTAEPWDFWMQHPDLVEEVDFIAIHILPYWVEVPVSEAVDYVISKYWVVKKAYPHKMVIIAETGWPSNGPQKGAAEASLANQAWFTREFIRRAEEQKIPFNIIEAFDQPWKSKTEGIAGEHWGIMDANRKEKFPLAGPVLEDPHWLAWAVSSGFIGFLGMGLYLFRRRQLHVYGQLFGTSIIQISATSLVLLAREASEQYMSPGDIAFWTIMVTAQILLAIIFVTDATEVSEVVGKMPLKRRFPLAQRKKWDRAPFVSIHLACCKEPPAMVIATLESLARLDYPNFEVIVVDNNTLDETLWRPVEQRCRELNNNAVSTRIRFYSLGKWPGFKAGALNYARQVTSPKAEIIGVVDADYIVEKNWLSMTVPYFKNSQVAVVQAPQEHRGWQGNLFQKMENDEYSGFFRIGMVQRNEDNAIIQHGTMTLICRKTLDQLEGWAEWCICEDAELGLRILMQHKELIYINEPLGRGLVPDSYEAYAKQRFRWAYGAMRILRRYWLQIFGLKKGLSRKQRYQFLKGWLPWIGDSLHGIFTILSLVWSIKLIVDPLQTEFPDPIFVYPAMALVLLRYVGTALTYSVRVKIGPFRSLLAMIAGGALTHTVAKAVIQGLFVAGKPFYRTPKMDRTRPFRRSIVAAREEILIGASVCACAIALYREFGLVNGDGVVWMVALCTQSLPYLNALLLSLMSSFSGYQTKDSLSILGQRTIHTKLLTHQR